MPRLEASVRVGVSNQLFQESYTNSLIREISANVQKSPVLGFQLMIGFSLIMKSYKSLIPNRIVIQI